VMTEKDAVKWPAGTPASVPLFVAAAGVRFDRPGALQTLVRAALRGGRRP